jgi:2-polyprenyl-6-methoxyphenol hydroxylase-like FAD-dependent oxidoreductase
LKVVVAGAGIGGLSLAIALRRARIDVVVLERARDLVSEGAGLMLQVNAMKALRLLELDEAVASIGAPVHVGLGRDMRGRPLSRIDMQAISNELGAPVIALHRGRLHELLVRKLGGAVEVRTNARVAGYEEGDGQIAARLDDGELVRGDLLVGADGLRSVVRAQMVGDGAPRYAGYTSWRGVAPVAGLCAKNAIIETWGHGLRFGMVEISSHETYWFAVANAPEGERDDDAHATVTSRFSGWADPIPALVAATPKENVLRTDIHDREPIDSFHRDRVALLGDAAHPTTPNLGQGACMAIEDAVVLARCTNALGTYDEKRVARTRKIVLDSRRFGKMGAISNPAAVFLRNLALKLTPDSVVASQSRKTLEVDL